MMRLCFDLDGTLCETDGDRYAEAYPIRPAIHEVRRLYDAGHTIIIDTARGSETGIDWTELTKQQLGWWGVPYHRLRCGVKVAADVYIDDRAKRPEEMWTLED